MAKDNRRIITWTHIEGTSNYRNDIKNYWNRIYSIGIHEFGVRANGKIYDYTSERNYFDANGNHTGVRFPVIIEQDMIDYPSIKWFLQCICFDWSTVKPFLDNNVRNSEGRYPQDQFIYELGKIIDIYKTSRSSGTPLPLEGIEMDVEASMTSDPVSQGYDLKYIQFLERLKNDLLIPRGLKLRINSFAMWGNNVPYYYRFHNYKLFAESTDKNGNATIDEIQLMTYDFAWAGSSAGASTPIWWFENVGEWCLENFDPKRNPRAKLTIDNLYFGAAGYGHRWGMFDQEVVKRGGNITYHQLLGWQNGQYRHYKNIDGVYVYQDQEYLYQTSFQDDESKNEVMYPHVYDIFKPKYAEILTLDNGKRTATVGTYNRLDYATTNFKQQIPIWRGVKAIANRPTSFSGKAYPMAVDPSIKAKAEELMIDVKDLPDSDRQTWDRNLDPNSLDFQHLVKTVDGQEEVFVGWFTEDLIWVERYEYDELGNVIGAYCEPESKSEGRINYEVNIPTAGNYHLVAITSFSWYTQAKLGGYVNGQRFEVGGDNIPEWFPFFLKGAFFYDCGTFSFKAGTNTIDVRGELSDANTPIYGFIVCQDFDQNFSGGELTFKTDIQPFLKKDGTPAAIPTTFALACKMLRRDARPAIIWDDEFRTYEEGTDIAGTTYYQRIIQDYKQQGGGTYVEQIGVDENEQPIYKCFSEPADIGYSLGEWLQEDDGTGRQSAHFNSSSSGQLVLSKQWSVNLSIETRLKVVDGAKAGIRFYAQKQGTVADGYVFLADLQQRKYQLIYENNGSSTVVASQNMGALEHGDTFRLKALLYNGVGRFYMNDVQVFVEGSGNPVDHDGSVSANGNVSLVRTKGAVGIYAHDCELYCYHLGIGTLDRWETMEKFKVIVDGQEREFGRINRTGYSYDEFGYLIYSGLDETATRDAVQYPFEEDSSAVSLDYEITVLDWASWQGAKDVKIKLVDAGVWFGELLIGDKEGMSVIWAGDAWSIIELMNLAVDKYGAKGIGLWAMGQEDPKVWDMIPDVVPKN